ncbi:MAG: hypothetical protein ACSNEK_08610 [Parachlamydiaceae bacterium]
MRLVLAEITQSNFEEHCFLPSKKREQVDFQPHEGEKWHLQIFNSNSIKDWESASLKLKKRFTQKDSERYSNRKKLISDSREAIEEHLDRRIQLFFQQAILCYNTPFLFEAEGAEDQIGIGSTIKGLTHKTQAAHSSTFPCLYAYPKDVHGKVDRNKRFVFLKYSHFYNQQNSTVELPIEVNQADTELDGKIGQEKLRSAGIKIINDTALGKINPTKATKRFLKVFEARLIKMKDELKKNDLRRDVLKIYLSHLREVRENIKESSVIFDQIMGVALPDSETVLRDVVYKKRFELIQQAEFIESQIAKRIFQAQKTMLKHRVRSLKSVDYRLRYVLLDKAGNDQERKFLEKLFCTSIEQLKTNIENKKVKLRRVENTMAGFAKKHKLEIQNLTRDLRAFRREIQKLELEFRSKLFRGIRVDFKDWYQKDFVARFKKLYPNEPMSQPMVSRLEQPARLSSKFIYATPESQRRKEMDIAKAQKIAATFGIDVGLFLPGLIASEY